MTGTIINILAVLLGSLLGVLFGGRLPERMREAVMSVLGLFTLGLGVMMFLKSENVLVVLAALLTGTLLGEWWRIEEGLAMFGEHLKASFSGTFKAHNHSRFVEGFITASILFCVGPMAILGSIQDGLTGDFSLLATKSIMDGFAALAFTSTMGIGVAFSVIVILVFQGGISLLATQIQNLATPAMINEMSAAGGVILMGVALGTILNLRKIRTGNFLPALFLAPLFAVLAELLGLL